VCDIHGLPDQVLNVVTSLPYIGVGVWSARKRRFESGRLWGASVAGVGVASCVFHSTHGSWRTAGALPLVPAPSLPPSLAGRAPFSRACCE